MKLSDKLYAVPVGKHFIEIRIARVPPVCLKSTVKLKPVMETLSRRVDHYPYVEMYKKEVTPIIRTMVYEGGEVLATFKKLDFVDLCMRTEGMTKFNARSSGLKKLPEEGGANLLRQLHKRPGRTAR